MNCSPDTFTTDAVLPYWRHASGRGTSIDADAIMVDVAPTLADFATT
jgi:hypothetical protein